MEFLNGIFCRGFRLSGHKRESFQTWVFVWFFTRIFPFYKMLFTNRLEFLKPEKSMVFFKKPPVEGTVNGMEQKGGVFVKSVSQEFHLRILLL